MAEFCKNCGIEMWGFDNQDWAGVSTPEDTEKGLYAPVLCESCGPCLVDHTGLRIDPPDPRKDPPWWAKLYFRYGKIMLQTIRNTKTWEPYMTRLRIGRFRLHIFHRGDLDPDPHDHPFDFWTFPLASYPEEVEGEIRIVKAFRLHYRPANYTHRVLSREDGRKVITLVWTSKPYRDWGFTVEGKKIPWKDYIYGSR